ncbi:MAG TPA: methyltransferase domain-containing protein [Gammaproteobacteria bacterium]|nr:methyltransferase domain-containing protein [Gammaproteobacteria bacterium]
MLTQRSQEKELIDLGPDHYTPEEYQNFLSKLFIINKLLGIFKSTVKTIKRFPAAETLADIGCGGGQFLLHLSEHFPAMHLIGLDISTEAIHAANQTLATWKETNPAIDVGFYLQPQPELKLPENSLDLLVATLVCHHLSDEELIEFLHTAATTAKQAVILNDLYRHRMAQWLHSLFSPLLGSRLICYDGSISIRRGFTRSEWELLLKKAKVKHYEISLRLPFWWQVVLWK